MHCREYADLKKRPTKDAVKIIYDEFYRGKPAQQASLEIELINARIASDIYSLRTRAGLTRKQLARLAGTAPSVISRLEDADYPLGSLRLLQKIATALNRHVEFRFVFERRCPL